jgi:hypothetical protein
MLLSKIGHCSGIVAATCLLAHGNITNCAPSSTGIDEALKLLDIPDSDNIRGYITLPTALPSVPGSTVVWKSSNTSIVSDKPDGKIAAGVVTRPLPGSVPAKVKLTACLTIEGDNSCREFQLTVQPLVEVAQLSRYGMFNFARSNSQDGQQIYMASSVGNDATTWTAVNEGQPVLISRKGMYAVRDPSIVRSPEGDKFYLLATDLNVDGVDYGWLGWDWAQTNASRYIEVWESRDLRTWSEQRHVLVAPAEAGMAFAPEATWDPEIGAYVVYWTSSMYPPGTYYTPNATDPNRRYPLTRNQALYTTTRDFVTFTPPKVMSGRPGHGALDTVIIRNDDPFGDKCYHRFVCDRISTGNATQYTPCGGEDIYQERSRSVLASEDEWELVAGCITHKTMNTTYAEAPLVVRANPRDPRGTGYYMYVDQKWSGSSAGQPFEEQLHPYWTTELSSGDWTPIEWTQKPNYNLAQGVIRHGSVIGLTTAEHAGLRGAELISVSVAIFPKKLRYAVGQSFNPDGLRIEATYSDKIVDEVFLGYGGYQLSGFSSETPGTKRVVISYTVLNRTETVSFDVTIRKRCA